jgi:putative ABC transport system permease protein
MSRRPRLAEPLYRLLLLAYPPGFRRRHGEEMVRVFRDLCRAETVRHPRSGRLRAVASSVLDLLRTAPAAWLDALRSPDLRYAARGLRHQPGFALVALGTLALGIGANTALFSVLDAVVLRPLPYGEPERLVALFDTHRAQGRDHERPSPGNFLDWRQKLRSFEAMAAWQDGSGTGTLRRGDEAIAIETVKVTPDFFRVLAVPPALGRTFGAADERGAIFNVADRYSGGDRVLVISHRLWNARFGGDPGIVDRDIDLDGDRWRVLGVMPESFDAPRSTTEAWIPWDIVPSFPPEGFPEGPPRDYRFLNVLARLGPGTSVEQADTELRTLAAALAERHPEPNAGWSARAVPLQEETVGHLKPAMALLAGAVSLVLLLACANVASLQLARASARRREMAVRLALGGDRARLVRQLLTESLLLAVLGGLLGLAVAHATLSAILAADPQGLPRLSQVSLDGRTLAFSLAVSLVTGVLFGLVPALEASRTPVAGALQDGGRATTAGPGTTRARRLLIVAEVAMALVLLTGASLLARSFLKVMAVDPGFDPRELAALRVTLDHATYKNGAQSRQFYRELMGRLAALPGVQGVGAVTALPLSPVGTDFARPYWREGEADPGGRAPHVDIRMVTPGYFDAMRMTVRRGRPFTDADGAGTPRVIAVNETLARQAWPDREAVGHRLILDYLGGAYPYEVVAVVNDTRFRGLKTAPRPELFIPHAQNPYLDLSVVLRTAEEPASLLRAVRREIRALDPRQPIHGFVTMDDLVRRSVSADRLATLLLGLLAGLALALAATGIYGVLSFLVAHRTQEIGVRMALGATRAQVVRLVMAESLRLTIVGAGAGLLAVAGFLRPMGRLLYGVGPIDPVALGGGLSLLAAVALLAGLQPARRASRLDPLAALRSD